MTSVTSELSHTAPEQCTDGGRADWIYEYEAYLRHEEKSAHTIEKYVRDVRRFLAYVAGGALTKDTVVAWRESLVEAGYAPSSVNSMLAAVNCLLVSRGLGELRAKGLRVQRKAYTPASQELTRSEYKRLLRVSRRDPRLCLILQTICATGIRVSELAHFSVEEVRVGEVRVRCKGKTRVVLIPRKLRKRLLGYAQRQGITHGVVFRTRGGRPVDRSNIWAQMKALCAEAGVSRGKVFPHNLRKLFARAFYHAKRDLAKLADVLGHSSIETTRIYVRTTAHKHQRLIDQLNLVL